MKKVFLTLALTVTLFSCSSDEVVVEPVKPPYVDCNCDRIATQTTFNVIGTPLNPATTYYYKGTTINDCTKEVKNFEYTSKAPIITQKIGECRR